MRRLAREPGTPRGPRRTAAGTFAWWLVAAGGLTACQSTDPVGPNPLAATDAVADSPTIAPIIQRAPSDQSPSAETAPPHDAHRADWKFRATLFAWLVGIEGVASNGTLGTTINQDFSDILDNLNGAVMGAFTARHGQWGIQADLTWAKIDVFNPQPLVSTDLDLETTIGEVDVLFSPERAKGLDFLAGARVLDLDADLTVGQQRTFSGGITNVDPIIGAQGTWELSDHWGFRLRGDVGGFGAASKLTYQAYGVFRWGFAKNWGMDLGYRLIGYDIDSSGIDADLEFHGPILGVDFTF